MENSGKSVPTRTDGVTGVYSPLPSETDSERTQGAGLDGLSIAETVSRQEQIRELHLGQLASVHSWELVTAVDGPGTRMTVFLSGCPLHCLYCHNPDTMDMRRGEMVPTAELIGRMNRYKSIFTRTNGGITLSGGEPLMQPRVVEKIFRAAKESSIHTAIDTSGNLGWRCTDSMLDDLDLCLLDIKSGDPETYKQVTGQELQPTLDFAKRLAQHNVDVWVRFVLVPNLTDAPENIEQVADYSAAISTCRRVEVLPFHQMGRDKWQSLGLEYQLEQVEPPSVEQINSAKESFARRGLVVY